MREMGQTACSCFMAPTMRALDRLALRAVKPASVEAMGTRRLAASPSRSRSATLWSETPRRCRRTGEAGHLLPHTRGHSPEEPDQCHTRPAPDRLDDHKGWRGTSSQHPSEYSRPGGRGATLSSHGRSRPSSEGRTDQSYLRTAHTLVRVMRGITASSASLPHS